MLRWLTLVVLVVTVSATAAWLSVSINLTPGVNTPGQVALPGADLPNTGPPPRLVVDQDLTHDFGVMAQHKEGSHDWVLRNEGEGDLILLAGQPSCSCTATNLPPNTRHVIKPGESFTVNIEWNTKTFSDHYSQTVPLRTNDPHKPEIVLTVKGVVRPPVFMLPPTGLNVGSVSNLAPKEFSAMFSSPARPETKILEIVTARPDLLEIKTQPLTAEEAAGVNVEQGTKLLITVKPTETLGAFSDELVIKTDHPDNPEVRYPISGRVVGPISVMPPQVRLSTVRGEPSDGAAVTLWVQGQDETEFQVVQQPEKLKVAIAPVDDKAKTKNAAGHPYRMTVTVEPDAPPGLIQAPIVLKTNHPKAGEIRVPVHVIVAGEG